MASSDESSRPDPGNDGTKPLLIDIRDVKTPFKRLNVNERELNELAINILVEGLKNPIKLAPDKTCVDGHMRLLAHFKLVEEKHPKFQFISAITVPGLETYDKQICHLFACDVKSNRSALDVGFLLLSAEEHWGKLTDKEFSERLKINRTRVCRGRKAVSVPPDIMALLKEKKISFDHVAAAGKFGDKGHAMLRGAAGQTVKEMLAGAAKSKPRKPKALQFKHGGVTLTWEAAAYANQPELLEAATELVKKIKSGPSTIDTKNLDIETFLREMRDTDEGDEKSLKGDD